MCPVAEQCRIKTMKVAEKTIKKAATLLRDAAPGAAVILFDSSARDEADDDSDLDFLVIEPEVRDRHEEMVRLRDVLRPLGVPVDVLVVSEGTYRKWADTPGTVLYEAAKEGRRLEPVP